MLASAYVFPHQYILAHDPRAYNQSGFEDPSFGHKYVSYWDEQPAEIHLEPKELPSVMSNARTSMEQTQRIIWYIGIGGAMSAFAAAGIVLGSLALSFSMQQRVPTGTILLYSGSASTLIASNNNWLFCDGSAVSRSTYYGLFLVIGTTYGAGNGIDTFNLPDLRTRFPMGSNTSSQTSLASGGSATHTLTVSELPAHTHDQGSLLTSSSGTHTHTITDPGHNHGGSTGTASMGSGSFSINGVAGAGSDTGTHTHSISTGSTNIAIGSSGSHTHTISGSTGSTGLGQSIDMTPPYQTVHYIIRT